MTETKNENLNVFSNSFISTLKDINRRIKSPLVDYLLNTPKSQLCDKYRHLSLGLGECELNEYSAEEKEALKEVIFYTPKGKPMISQGDRHAIILKKYRQSGSIGSIINQLVEFNSKIVKGEKVSDSLGNEYLYDKKYSTFFNEKTKQPIFFEKEDWIASRKSYEYKKMKFSDSQYEQLANELKAELCSVLEFKLLSGDDIVKYYDERNYSSKYGEGGGCLHASCMRYSKCRPGIEFYANNPNAQMLVMMYRDKIVARTMVWKTDMGIFMDRKYYSADFLSNSLIQYAREHKWHYKTVNSYSENYKVTAYNHLYQRYDDLNWFAMNVEIPDSYDGIDLYPYMDTFDKLYPSDGVISNYYRYSKGASYQIKSTGLTTSGLGANIRSMFEGRDREREYKSSIIEFGLYRCLPERDFNKFLDFEGNFIPSNCCSDRSNQGNNVNMYDCEAVERFKDYKANKKQK